MAKLSASKCAATKKRTPSPRNAQGPTFTQENVTTKETIILSILPNTHFTFEGREHQLWISINKHGEPLLRFKQNGRDRMMIVSHTDETALLLSDSEGNDVGEYVVRESGEVTGTLCKTRRHVEPLIELMTTEARTQTLTGGVGKFTAAAYQQLLDLQPQALTALSRQIQLAQEQKQGE